MEAKRRKSHDNARFSNIQKNINKFSKAEETETEKNEWSQQNRIKKYEKLPHVFNDLSCLSYFASVSCASVDTVCTRRWVQETKQENRKNRMKSCLELTELSFC